MDALKYYFEVNGLGVEARYDRLFVTDVLTPVLRELSRKRQELGRRLIVYLVAPPAAGKSTLALLIEKLSQETPGLLPVQAVGLDGFHYHQSYLLSHFIARDGGEIPLVKVKGGPESYDVEKLADKLRECLREDGVLWPFYDRRKHDVVDDAILLDRPIVLVEGNWLLLDDPLWKETSRFCDYSISIRAPESLLRERLIRRKLAGGFSLEEALAHYDFNDGPNIRRYLRDGASGDLRLIMTGDGEYAKEDDDVQPV